VRVFINDKPFGLYTLADDISTHLIDNMVHGGDWKYDSTGKRKREQGGGGDRRKARY
jgi:hypothetical protein